MIKIKNILSPIIITGPTCSGKNKFAYKLAKRFPSVIINADALQVYTKWKILTGRPTAKEIRNVRHKLFGYFEGNHYHVGKWLADMKLELSNAQESGLTPIIVGGTGLYLTLLLRGISKIPPISDEIRAKGNEMLNQDPDYFLSYLEDKDPGILKSLDQKNPRRLQRAWEIFETTGFSLANFQLERDPPLINPEKAIKFVLYIEKKLLNGMIDDRFDRMIAAGAIYECQRIIQARAWNPNFPSSKVIGASDLMSYIKNEKTLNMAIEDAKIKTHQFAKKQRTWLRMNMKSWQKIFVDKKCFDFDKQINDLNLSII